MPVDKAMYISEIIVVYLSLGAPLAAYHFFESQNDTPWKKVVDSGIVLVLWPVKSTLALWRQFSLGRPNTDFAQSCDLDASIERKSAEVIASLKDTAILSGAVYEMRDVFDRYAALMAETRGASSASEFLRIAGRTDAAAGVACLNRRNAARLKRHQTDARRALIAAVERALPGRTVPTETVENAIELAELLGDAATEMTLREILRERDYWTKPEGESWKSEPEPTHAGTSQATLLIATASSRSD